MFKIKIFEGTDTIKIGMTSQEISGIVGEMPEKTPKGEGERLADMYDFGFIYYDKSGKCEAIEFFDTAQVEWNGGDLMKKSKWQSPKACHLQIFLNQILVCTIIRDIKICSPVIINISFSIYCICNVVLEFVFVSYRDIYFPTFRISS